MAVGMATTKERIGYRFLYDAIGCSLAGREDLYLSFPIGDHLHAGVYLGPRPKYGIAITHSTSKYLVLGENTEFRIEMRRDATQSSYPRHFFLEIAVWQEIEVPEKLSSDFRERQPEATNKLLALAEQNRDAFAAAIILMAGTIGLRFHAQFVLEIVNENPIALVDDDDYRTSAAGSAVRQMQNIRLPEIRVQQLTDLLQAVGAASQETRDYAANALGWLIRAWYQHDLVSQFLMLFIGLEFLLDGVSGSLPVEFHQEADEIRELIKSHGSEKSRKLTEFFDRLVGQQRPSLNSRFEQLASQAKLPGWQHDVDAFKKFNKQRNDLIHQGDPGVKITVSVTEDEVRHFQDMVERYVSLLLFGDAQVYQDQWLRRPSVQ